MGFLGFEDVQNYLQVILKTNQILTNLIICDRCYCLPYIPIENPFTRLEQEEIAVDVRGMEGRHEYCHQEHNIGFYQGLEERLYFLLC